jgi:hypothetical protein
MQKFVIVLVAMALMPGAAFAGPGRDDAPRGAAAGAGLVLAQADPGNSSTAEIPSNSPSAPASGPDATAIDQDAGSSPNPNELEQYENQQVPLPNISSLQEFINQGTEETPIGVQVEEDCTRLADHERVCGLAVLDVKRNSPAALAGIKPYSAVGRDLLDGASVAAAFFFPPAIVAVGIISQTHVGESFDLIIGVDGQRTRHLLDFEDLTANDKPGEVIYLTIVRHGKRMQIPVHLPATYSAYSY